MTHLLFGATGLIGHHVAEMIPPDDFLITITRKPLLLNRKNYLNIVSDFSEDSFQKFSFPSAIDFVFCCIGTTIKIAGSQEKFFQVDHDLVVSVAKLANQLKVKKILVISALGADPKSSVFYNRVKGKMERDTIAVTTDIPQIIFLRPSLLLGDRAALGQPTRLAEKIGILLGPLYSPIFIGPLKKYRPVQAKQVARKMLDTASNSNIQNHLIFLENQDI